MLRVLPTLFLSGCCCCWPFGGDGGGDGFVSDYVSEVVAEEIGEQMVEAMTGAENVEIGDDGSFTATGPDGQTIEMRMDDDGQMVMTNGDETATFGPGEIPDGFPITPIDGAAVVTVMDMSDGQMVTLMSDHTKDELYAHYAPQLEAVGTLETPMDLTTPDGSMTSWMVQSETGPTIQVMVMTTTGEASSTTITVTP